MKGAEMNLRAHAGTTASRTPESGFTLVEALIAIVVLVVGIVAIVNLFVVASTSNAVANHSTAASGQGTETLERLKSIPFLDITAGMGSSDDGDLDADAGSILNCVEPDPQPPLPVNCVVPGNYNLARDIPGVGRIKTRWRIVRPGAGGPDTLFIVVRSESTAKLAGIRSRSEYTTFRTCTVAGCPF
jgi:pilin/secretion family protein with methylation motif